MKKLFIIVWVGLVLATASQSWASELMLPSDTVVSVAISEDAKQAVKLHNRNSSVGYWTPERMAEALASPEDYILPGNEIRTMAKDTSFHRDLNIPVKEMSSPPYCPDCDSTEDDMWPSHPQPVSSSCAASSYSTEYDSANTSFPQRAVGRLFFSTGETNHSCSASLVGPQLVLTAGHCVTQRDRQFSNHTFIPGYAGGAEPYGRAAAVKIWTLAGWRDGNDLPYDVAFIELDRPMGDSVGWLGLKANLATNQTWLQYGYPARRPYDGSLLVKNVSTMGHRDAKSGQPATIGVGSPLTSGSSGGPWFINGHYANGLNSYRYLTCIYTIYSPYFGEAVWNAFSTAIAETGGTTLQYYGVNRFVANLYQNLLHREPKNDEIESLADRLNNGQISASDAVRMLFFSQEFTNLCLEGTDLVTTLYLALFARSPDRAGLASWSGALQHGTMNGEEVLAHLLSSPEFNNLCQHYGLSPS